MACKFESLSRDMELLSKRIRHTEDLLSTADMPDDERGQMEKDLCELKDLLEHHRKHLTQLRSNRKFFMFATAFMVAAFIVLFLAYSKMRSFDSDMPIVTRLT